MIIAAGGDGLVGGVITTSGARRGHHQRRRSQDVTLDGEVRGQTPLHAHMAKQALRIIIGKID